MSRRKAPSAPPRPRAARGKVVVAPDAANGARARYDRVLTELSLLRYTAPGSAADDLAIAVQWVRRARDTTLGPDAYTPVSATGAPENFAK